MEQFGQGFFLILKSRKMKKTNIVEVFIEHLDNIFYEGYAYQLAAENPEAYTFEFNQFMDSYNFKK